MKVTFARGLAATTLFLLAPASGFAQSSDAEAPTTKILAIGTVNPGVDPASVRAILPAEVRETVELYLDGKIDQWYALQGHMGVVFLLNVTNQKAAREMLEKLPLGRAHLMTFELSPLSPLTPLRALPGMAATSSR